MYAAREGSSRGTEIIFPRDWQNQQRKRTAFAVAQPLTMNFRPLSFHADLSEAGRATEKNNHAS